VQTTEIENLQILTIGTMPPNPDKMLESKKMRDFLEAVGGRRSRKG
jgi:Mrp family chromosome partitioning ATPase